MRDHESVVRMNSTDGRDTHDAPPMTLAHVGNDGTAKSAHGRELGHGHLLPVRLRSRQYATRTCSPSIVDHNIDAAKTLHGGCNHAVRLARITHICLNPQHFDAEPVANVLGCVGKALGTSGDKNKIHTTAELLIWRFMLNGCVSGSRLPLQTESNCGMRSLRFSPVLTSVIQSKIRSKF